MTDSNASDLRRRRRIKWWWNFIARTDEEIREAREDWMTGDRFGEVKGYDGDRLDAPEVPVTRLKARGRGAGPTSAIGIAARARRRAVPVTRRTRT